MKRFLLGILLVISAAAQPILSLSGPISAYAGSTVNVILSASATAGSGLAAGQWTYTLPAGLTLSAAPTVTAGATALGLGAYCNQTSGLCVLVGLTTAGAVSIQPWTDGQLVTAPIAISSTAALGNATLTLSGLLGASTTAGAVILSTGTPYTLKILSKCDVNGDGTVNVADVQLVISALLTGGLCPLSGASCTLSSIVKVIIAVSGGACSL